MLPNVRTLAGLRYVHGPRIPVFCNEIDVKPLVFVKKLRCGIEFLNENQGSGNHFYSKPNGSCTAPFGFKVSFFFNFAVLRILLRNCCRFVGFLTEITSARHRGAFSITKDMVSRALDLHFCSKTKDPTTISVEKPMVRARRRPGS